MRTSFMLMLAILCGALSGACRGGNGNPAGPSEPIPTVLTVNNTVPGVGYFRQDVNVLRGSTMNATLAWSGAFKDLDLYLTNDGCQWDRGVCTMLAQSEQSSGNREQIAASVAAGQTYRLWIINRASTSEAFNLEMVIR